MNNQETQPPSPWLLRFWRIGIAKRPKGGTPALAWATGYVRITNRIFWQHRIRKGDIVQIRGGWNANLTGCFGHVDRLILESIDLSVPAPAEDGSVVLKVNNVPAGALMRVGKGPASFHGQQRRNPRKLKSNAKS